MIQCDGFIWKVLCFAVLLLLSYFVPNEFFYGWGWIAVVASGFFLVVQTILIIDWAYEIQLKFAPYEDELEERGISYKQVILLVGAAFFAIGGLVVLILAIVFYGSLPHCHLNRFFILFTLGLGIVTTILGIICRKGVLPGTIVFFCAMFICWSALLSNPDQSCVRFIKPSTNKHTVLSYFTTAALVAVASFSIIRTALVTGGNARKLLNLKSNVNDDSDDESSYEEINGDDNEESNAEENGKEDLSAMWWAHFVFILSSFFMDMVLTNWSPDDYSINTNPSLEKNDSSAVAVWIKMSSQWLMFLLYAWSCIAPFILGKWREFEH